MILAACLIIGLLLRVASGRSLSDLASVGLRGESLLVGLLLLQVLPAWIPLTGTPARIAYFVWLATFPCMAAVAWLNRRQPGMAMLGVGLLLNFAVIGLNGGMPVAGPAIAAAKPSLGGIPITATDFVHVAATAATRLPWLADVIPVPGPSWLRSVASPGDCLLFAGIVAFLAAASGRESQKGGTT